ncbi:leucine-rich repeat domain-containing protein [Maribacter sp. Asnod1-A12]|uniref:leucine-rich repeat domain-containing protein n=1 Tax=Maribacter sp. Asnod1-A12 TaxID=3160576 RepID=UPI00386CCDF4
MQYQKMPANDELIETGDLRRVKSLIGNKVRFVLQNRKLKRLAINTTDFNMLPHLEFDLSYNKTLNHEELFIQLSKLKNLKGLGLIKNATKELPESIGNLKALEILDLRSNGLKILPPSFSSLDSLTFLNLRNNNLTTYPEQLNGFKNLKYLNLRFNKLKKLPATFFNLKNLEELDLSSSGLSVLPVEIGNLTNLKVLYLESNKLKSLPKEIANLKNLETIHLKGNAELDLEQVCKVLAGLPSLKHFSFRQWKLKDLPESLGDMTQLESLDLEENNLVVLPDSLKKLKNLKEIKYQDNPELNLESLINNLASWPQIKEFRFYRMSLYSDEEARQDSPNNLGLLKNLESLSFSYLRGLKNISETIGELNDLKSLNIISTGVIELPKTIGKLEQLESLVIRNNPDLTQIPESLYNLTDLKELHWLGNGLALNFLKVVAFEKLEKITAGTISNADFKLISQLLNLKEIYWRDEEITSFPEEFYSLKHIESIQFSAFPNLDINQEIDKLAKMSSIKKLEFNFREPRTLDWYIENLQQFPNLEYVQIVTQDKVIPSSIVKLSFIKELKIDIQGNTYNDIKDIQLPLEYAILPQGWIKFTRLFKVLKSAEEALITIDKLQIKSEQERMIAFALLSGYYKPLFEILKNPFEEGFTDGSVVYVSGKPSMGTLKNLKDILGEKGFKVKTKPIDVSYVLINPKVDLKDIEKLFNKGFNFFLEDHLKEQLIEEDTPYLLEESSTELIQQITRLLKAKDEDQLALILPVIEGGGANRLIISYLVAIHLFHTDIGIRKTSRNLFKKYASSDLQNHIKNTWKDSYKKKELENFKKIYHHDEIDLCAFILAFKMIRWHQANKEGRISDYFINSFGRVYLEKVGFNQITESLNECDFIHTLRIMPSEPIREEFLRKKIHKLPLHTLNVEQSMDSFPASFLEIPTLEKLSIGHWQASGDMRIPDLSQINSSLKELIIVKLNLKDVDNLKSLINITRLHLNYTGLSNISFIESYKKLEFLNLSNNQITELPSFIETFESLDFLSLDQNPLENITINFNKLQKLRSLNLSDCKLSDLPDTFENCLRLEEVTLRNNELKNLPVSLFSTKGLSYRGRSINAQNNHLSSIGVVEKGKKHGFLGSLFQSNEKTKHDLASVMLNRINLNQNDFKEIPTLFFSFKQIRELNMQENAIEKLPDEFEKLKVDEIRLSKTIISKIPISIFRSEARYIGILSDADTIEIPDESDIPFHDSRIFVDGSEQEKEKMTNFRKAVNEKQNR